MVARTLDFVWMSYRGTNILTGSLQEETLREKCPYSDFFWSIFSRIWTFFTLYLSVCSPNAGKYGPEKLRIRPLFTQWKSSQAFKYSEITTDKLLIVLLLSTGMWCRSLLPEAFWQSKQFLGKCACPILSVYCPIKKWLLKVNFSQKYKVFLPKKIQNELGTNKQPSLVTCLMCHPKWEQNSSHHFCHYRCQKSERNPKGEVEWKHNYLNKNICYIRKIHLVKKLFKPTTLYLLWKPTKMSTFMPFTSSSGSDRSSPS